MRLTALAQTANLPAVLSRARFDACGFSRRGSALATSRTMKTIIISLVALLVGVGIGWYVGCTASNAETEKEVGSVSEAQESAAAMAAALAADTVRFIDSGDTRKALQCLSTPIAHYWTEYAIYAGTNSERLKVRSYIEQWASTNQIVAARISNDMVYVNYIDAKMK